MQGHPQNRNSILADFLKVPQCVKYTLIALPPPAHGYFQGASKPYQDHMVLGLRVLALWNGTLHFLVPSLWPCSLPMFPLCTVCPQCWPQAQLGLAVLLLRFHAQRCPCPGEPAPVSLPQDNASCPGGGAGMTGPQLLRAHSRVRSHCFCVASVHKSTFMGPSNPATQSQNQTGSLSLLYLLSSQERSEFSFLQQNVPTLLMLGHSLMPQHGVSFAELQDDR